MHIAEVQLHIGKRHPQQRVAQGNGGVGERTRIDQDAVHTAPSPMDALHQGSLVVALKAIQLHAQPNGLASQLRLDRLQRVGAIEARLPQAKQVEVRPVQQQHPHRQRR